MARIEFEIIDHGCDGEQYFPGCGVAYSRFTDCVTGSGYSAREAAEDALEQMCMTIPAYVRGPVGIGFDPRVIESAMDDQGLTLDPSFDPEDPEISPEWHHYVSIRWRVID